MRNIIFNLGYFFKEVRTIIKLNAVSNLFSVISTGLIFFILAMVISGWWSSSKIVEAIQGEAEIDVYYAENADDAAVKLLLGDIGKIDGVREARLVERSEAYSRMEEILGKEAAVMGYFNDNPFSPFIEIKIEIEDMSSILGKLGKIEGIEYVRDNREILDRIQNISKVLTVIGYLVVTAVGISTLVIIAHIIRMGIYDSKEQINTLRLMGAPESFIAFPFIMEGLFITMAGGFLATLLSVFSINYVYGQMAGPLPFIPLPPSEALISGIAILIMALSAVLGIMGSAFGLRSADKS